MSLVAPVPPVPESIWSTDPVEMAFEVNKAVHALVSKGYLKTEMDEDFLVRFNLTEKGKKQCGTRKHKPA